jgi:GAF domain-containing protein
LLLTLQNAQLHYDRERLFLRESELSNLSRKINVSLESKVLFHTLLTECCSIFQAEFALLFNLDEKGTTCSVYYVMGTRFAESSLPTALLDEWLASREEPAFVSDGEGLDLIRKVLNQEVRCWISAPIVIQDRLAGSLELASFDSKRFKETDILALLLVAQQAALAINNSRLYAKLLNSLKEISEARKEVEKVRRDQFL